LLVSCGLLFDKHWAGLHAPFELAYRETGMEHMSQPNPDMGSSRPPNQSFSWFLIVVGLPFLGLGGWGIYQGYVTLQWPRATAVILDANLRVQESDASRRKTATHTVDIRYKYTVDGKTYHGDGIEVADFGLQNSALAQKQYDKFPAGTTAEIAYDPVDPAVSYLQPGPSSTSLLLAGIGGGLILVGLMVRRMIRLKASEAALTGTVEVD
jgi:hypothetical protein